jgi:uncharacterized protein YkwD
MKPVKKLPFLLLFCWLASPSSVFAQMSDALEPNLIKYCEDYSAKQFFALPEVNAFIDFQQINYPLLVAAVFHETNVQREKKKLPACAFSVELCRAGATHVADMKKNGYFDHANPKKKAQTDIKVRFNKYIKGLMMMGENIDMTYVFGEKTTYADAAREALQDWLNSPGHRANIYTKGYKMLGTGALMVEYEGDGMASFYYIQCFGSK